MSAVYKTAGTLSYVAAKDCVRRRGEGWMEVPPFKQYG